MEHAAIHIARAAMDKLAERGSHGVLVLAGPGNNGGDGLAAARLLHRDGVCVRVLTMAEDTAYKGAGLTNMNIARRLGIPILTATSDAAETFRKSVREDQPGLIIDALLGTGIARPLSGTMLELVNAVNSRGGSSTVLSVDLPSGMDADTGTAHGACIRADATITLAAMKAGFLKPAAVEFLGTLSVADIGVPTELLAELGTPMRS